MKKVKDFTYNDYYEYCQKRVSDGNWDRYVALTAVSFLQEVPKKKLFESKQKYYARREAFFQKNLPLLWNLEDYPNMKINIETGDIKVK